MLPPRPGSLRTRPPRCSRPTRSAPACASSRGRAPRPCARPEPAGTQTAFWFYTFRFIDVNANPMGDGLEWMAVFPFGFVFFGLVVPALLLGAIGRLVRL